jgi:predicted dehydrogenase
MTSSNDRSNGAATAGSSEGAGVSRRGFVTAAALAGGAAAFGGLGFPAVRARGAVPVRATGAAIKVGVIGCGGRGTGAMVNSLEASPDTRIHALADAFADRIEGLRGEVQQLSPEMIARCNVAPANVFTGFDAYRKLLSTDCDVVILATPPGFRPIHFAAAVEAGKHVFMEKPVAVCPAGIRMVIEGARKAKEKKLNVVCGTQRRHESCYLEAMKRIEGGAIGKVLGATVYWNQGGLWMNKRRPEWSDVEWQLRNWLYFDWLSGDHIVEQHVHNLDVAAWAMGLGGTQPNSAWPVKVSGMGGRQSRTSPDYGHVFDHFSIQYEYADGRTVTSYCRQVDGADGRVEEVIHGSDGQAVLSSGRAKIDGKSPWRWEGQQENPYMVEHKDLLAGVTGGAYINEGERIAHSTMMAVSGRMSAYSGKDMMWERVMKSNLDLRPSEGLVLGPMATPAVAVPGKTGAHW